MCEGSLDEWVVLGFSLGCARSSILVPVLLQDGDGHPIDIQMKSRMDGTYACSYTPVKAIKHTIAVVWGGVNIPHSPYRVGGVWSPGC